MRTVCLLFLSFLIAFLTACTATPVVDQQTQDRVDDAAQSGQINFDQAVDVTEDGIIYVNSMQTPGLASPQQSLVWRCFGGGFDGGWQGQGCFPAIPVYNDNSFEGFGQVLPPEGIFRLSCAQPTATDDPQDPGWCRHWIGVDSIEEEEWLVQIDEEDPETGEIIQKDNLCVQMISGEAFPAEAACASLHVEP